MHQGDDSNGHAAMMPCAVAPEAAKVTASYAEKADTSRPQRVASGPSKAETDPFQTIADAMSRAARDMQESIDEPNAPVSEGQYGEQSGLLSRAVYSTSYCVGYGVGFPTFLVLGMVPTNNAFGRGLRDGMNSAKQSVSDRPGSRAAKKSDTRPATGDAPQPEAG